LFAALVGICALALLQPVGASAQDDTGDQSDTTPPAAATSIDPCSLVTSSEASALAGASFGPGMASTTDGGGRICVYGSQTPNVFMVLVGQEPDAATAQADWATEEARVQGAIQKDLPAGLNFNYSVTEDAGLPGYDRSATATTSATIGPRTINLSAIYLLKGPTFVSFSNLLLDNPAPTTDALGSQAQTVLSRLP
jgi:hypothetical protein